MTLEKAISYAIDNEGIGILSETRLKNYLNDLQAYDMPAIKRIVSTMVDDGYLVRIQAALSGEDYELQFNDVTNRLIQEEGFQADLVKYVMDCLLFSVHKTNNAPSLPQNALPPKKPTTRRNSSSPVKCELKVLQANGNYLIEFEGQSYELDESQYKAILRKKDMPADRLQVWLKSYAEENT